MNQVQAFTRFQKLEVIDPSHFGPIGIHDLFVQQCVLQQEFIITQGRLPKILRQEQIRHEVILNLGNLMPGDQRGCLAGVRFEKNTGDRRIRFSQVGHQVNDFTDGVAIGINDVFPQDLA